MRATGIHFTHCTHRHPARDQAGSRRVRLVLRQGLAEDAIAAVTAAARSAGFEPDALQPLQRFGILVGKANPDRLAALLELKRIEAVEPDERRTRI
jgi:hypothetical protein